jgi:cytochrome P450
VNMSASSQEQEVEQFDPFHISHIQEPFALFARLRDEQPVYWNSQRSIWMVSRYDDVKTALHDPTRFLSATGPEIQKRAELLPQSSRADFDIGYRFWYTTVAASDPPKHTQQRQSVMKAFTPSVIRELQAAISQRVELLLDNLEQATMVDFVAQFAYPLPSQVIFDLLGVPSQYHQKIREATAAIAQFPSAAVQGNLQQFETIARRVRQAEVCLQELIRQRRAIPTEDLISRLANEGDVSVRLSDDEIVVLCNFLLAAGHETTANLLAGSMRYLLQTRNLWDQLCLAPELLGNAIEELLRFVSPVLWVARVPAEDIELRGHVLRKGSRVMLGIGSANHDPVEFTDPETLDFARSKPHSLAFGYGPHFCVGATLARLETQIALAGLLRRFPDIRLVSETFDYQPIYYLRSLKTLYVAA